MADIKVRNLDDHIADISRTRAKHQGISLEEEIRRTLAASVNADLEAFARRAAAVARGRRPAKSTIHPRTVPIIREERDAWG